MHNAKVTSDELKLFYNTRAAIEDEYSRKLLSLCRKPLGSNEAGTLRASLDVMRGEVESMGKAHQTIAGQMKSELEEPLAAFGGGLKERRKIVQTGIEKLLKLKIQQTQVVNKARDRYEQDCLKIKGYLAQGHMVMGQEERKNKAKMEKTQIQLASTSNEYEAAVKALEETTGRWNRDWKAACDKFQDLEEERLDFMKSSLWTFANVASTSCEKIRLSLENCEVEKDITSFIQERGTGQEIPDPPKYINFCRGDLNDNASETSEDEAYSVAQFQRTINPAFRSSSPQPSTYESHHDHKSDLATRLGHQDPHTPPSREATMTPQKAAQQPPPPLDYRRQAQEQAKYQHIHQDELPTVPHNEYPTDGMTMFCRTGPPSERSSAASPARPSSRDSHSDYSNPTSFSSIEPANGKQSPVKQSAAGSAVPVFSPEKQVQKKRSGFFSNSPFRRKSKNEKDGREQQQPPMMLAPTAHNTWGSSSDRNGGNGQPSPTRGYGQGTQTSVFGSDRRSGSPEPADPRASFQLNVGNNVFDVASPDSRGKTEPAASARSYQEELDPIAQALAELKGVTKQSSVRMSADRYHGLATPAPGAGPSVTNLNSNNAFSAAQRGTPPPSYNEQAKVKRLDLPQPAFTSAQMQQTTRKYVGQNQDMYGSGSRPGTRGSSQHDMPRATSPAPPRSVSPRPAIYGAPGGHSARSVSPNPYAVTGGTRPRQSQSASPTKHAYGGDSYSSRHTSPNDVRRAASPQPQYTARPASSGAMALQLAPGLGMQDDIYGGSQRGRGALGGQRPTSYYAGAGAVAAGGERQDARSENRVRSKSVADGRQFTRDGKPILLFARALYMYHAAIPEELSFAKGDVLAVLRQQDDGWWEAEVAGKKGRPGLVPSNYLQQC
ncbi:SH3 domain [Lasallia pustulata]|uniref:SH3 domain n=1 Tax=Lasallia pustulata TaxID=136370 RepID=A0A1W5CWC6_9LECA|nr:SH3 domain [Lasallia pustulata]